MRATGPAERFLPLEDFGALTPPPTRWDAGLVAEAVWKTRFIAEMP